MNQVLKKPRWHRSLVGICHAVAVVLPLGVIWALYSLPLAELLARGGLGELSAALATPQGPWLMAALVVLGLLPVACMSYTFWQMARCFACLTRGEYFSEGAVTSLRRTTLGLALASATHLLVPTMASLVLSSAMPVGQRALVVSVGSSQLILLLVSLLLWQITAAMAQGVTLSEENQQFI